MTLSELLADLRGIAGGNLAVADDAVERRAHFGALQLLARGHDARPGRLTVALRGVAPDLGILELLGRDEAGLAQLGHALELPLGLLIGLDRGALAASAEVSVSRMAVSSRRTSRSPRRTGSPFSLSTARTTAETSARRSARRSGCTEPVIDGPDARALLRTVMRSSGEINNGG